ncbi:taste receptor type 2 member 10-like [Gracilinanus agilis]|uniref:taste receptor type 2 member 10-like n=1 Tax=Gracilinanus agilis TaxID=191870 RepID=UPI001CFE96AD|nr:taste receptor type 2 member 10-like [Gracilinanus agilis]
MSNVLEKICVTMAAGELLVGVLVNGFIGIVNFMDCIKTRKISYLNFILTGLAISRIGLLGILALQVFSLSFYQFYLKINWRDFNTLWILTNTSSSWFSAFLIVFYFLKIANFSHPIFLWLKWRVNRGVLRMLFGCYFLSFFVCLLLSLINNALHVPFYLENNITLTQKIQVPKTSIFYSVILLSFGGLIPLAMSLISCFLLVLSLWRHTWQMQLHITGSKDASMEAHIKAMKSMISFFFLFVLYYACILSLVKNDAEMKRKPLLLLILITMIKYPLVHSIILILGHSKLKPIAMRVLWKLRVCFKCSGKG